MAALLLIQKLCIFVFLVSSMLGSGMGLTVPLLGEPLRRWRFLLLALALNFLIAPGLAWLVTKLIPLAPGHAIALLLLGGAAGAPFLPKLVEIARGNLALAAATMALLTCGTIVFMPLALPLIIPGLTADAWSIARPLVLLILFPLAIGLLVRTYAASFAIRFSPLLAKISSVSLLLLFGLLVALNIPALLGVLGSGAILAAIIYVIALFVASWILSVPEREGQGVLALATTARNFGAALVPAANSFDDPNVTIALIVNAIVGLVFAFAAAGWVKRRQARQS